MTPDDVILTVRMMQRRVTTDDVDLLYERDGDRRLCGTSPVNEPSWRSFRMRSCPASSPRMKPFPALVDGPPTSAREASSSVGLGSMSIRRGRSLVGSSGISWAARHGAGTEGSEALLAHAFGQPRVDPVFAQTMSINVASRRVVAEMGMRHIRTIHQQCDDLRPGIEFGDVEYEMTRDMWVGRHGAGVKRDL